MPDLSVKNVPETLVMKLRERAALRHRSMQGELMALIQDALNPPVGIVQDRNPLPRRSGTRRIEDIAAAHRILHVKPFDKAPRAVDILRAERDVR